MRVRMEGWVWAYGSRTPSPQYVPRGASRSASPSSAMAMAHRPTAVLLREAARILVSAVMGRSPRTAQPQAAEAPTSPSSITVSETPTAEESAMTSSKICSASPWVRGSGSGSGAGSGSGFSSVVWAPSAQAETAGSSTVWGSCGS